jgi:alkyldihydroxyacetonephosphate synthase
MNSFHLVIVIKINFVINYQNLIGQALQTDTKTLFQSFVDGLKKIYITKFKGLELHKISVATLVFEGSKEEVINQENKVYGIAKQFK